MKVLFVSPSFYPAFHYGGPVFINRAFCAAMARIEGVDLRIVTTDANGPNRLDPRASQQREIDGCAIEYFRRTSPPDVACGLLLNLIGAIRDADVVHLNGVYSFTTIPTLLLCRVMRKPVVWSTMGALQRWQGTTRKRTKLLWETVCNRLCENNRVVMHVTSDDEREESLEKIPNAGALLLRNGIDLPELSAKPAKRSGPGLRLLYLGRLHPIKGIENLLRALPLMQTEVRLSICGAGEAEYEARLRSIVNELGLTQMVDFYGRVDGEAKEQHFREADLCIAPSFKEAFCTVALEAMARAVPVIVGRGIPWRRVEAVGCGLWVSNEPAELAAAIDRAAKMNLTEMGERGRAWMESEFSWPPVAAEMIDTYRRMAAAAAAPYKTAAPEAKQVNVS